MAVRIYQDLIRAVMKTAFLGTSSAGGTLSATPTVTVTGLDSGYTYGPGDAGFAAISAGVKTGLTADWDGEDTTNVRFTDSVLYLSDGSKTFSGNDDAAASLLLHVDHGAWEPLVCLVDFFDGDPFSIVNGQTASIQWSRVLGGVFQLVESQSFSGTSGFYPYAIEQAMGAVIGGSARTDLPSSVTLTIDLLTSDAERKWGHRFLSHIPDSWFSVPGGAGVAVSTASVTDDGTTACYLDGDDETFTAASGTTASRVLLYHDSGDPATSHLLGLVELDSALTLNGNDVLVEWASSAARILRMVAS